MNIDKIFNEVVIDFVNLKDKLPSIPLTKQYESVVLKLSNYVGLSDQIISQYLIKAELYSYATIISSLFTHPLHWLLIRFQTSHQLKSSYEIDTSQINKYISSVVKKEGYLSIYRGLLMSTLSNITYFGGSYIIHDALIQYEEEINKPILGRTYFDYINTDFRLGFLSGSISSMLAHPLDYLRNSMMSQTTKSNRFIQRRLDSLSIYHFYKIVRYNNSILGIYNYIPSNMIRGGLIYGNMCHQYYYAELYIKYYELVNLELVDPLATTMSSYITACFVSPFDAITSRLMCQHNLYLGETYKTAKVGRFYTNFFDCFLHSISMEDISQLWRGIIPLGTKLAFCFVLQKQFYYQIKEFVEK